MGGSIGKIVGGVAGSFVGMPTLGATIGGAFDSKKANKRAINAQQQGYQQSTAASDQATRDANAVQQDAFRQQSQAFSDQLQRAEPIRQAGLLGQNRLLDVLGLSSNTGAQGYGSANAKFGDRPFEQDPGYQFRLQQGQRALERSAAARGGLFSGRAAKDLQSYGQGMASQEYGNAFNRFQTERSNLLNPLESLANRAQGAVNSQGASVGLFGQQASNYANNVGNNLMNNAGVGGRNAVGAGDARASAYIGQENTANKALTSGYDAFKSSGGFNALNNSKFGAAARGFFGGSDHDQYGR